MRRFNTFKTENQTELQGSRAQGGTTSHTTDSQLLFLYPRAAGVHPSSVRAKVGPHAAQFSRHIKVQTRISSDLSVGACLGIVWKETQTGQKHANIPDPGRV